MDTTSQCRITFADENSHRLASMNILIVDSKVTGAVQEKTTQKYAFPEIGDDAKPG